MREHSVAVDSWYQEVECAPHARSGRRMFPMHVPGNRKEGVASHAQYQGVGYGSKCIVSGRCGGWYQGGGYGSTCPVSGRRVWQHMHSIRKKVWRHMAGMRVEGVLVLGRRVWRQMPGIREGECGVTHLVWVWKGVAPHALFEK